MKPSVSILICSRDRREALAILTKRLANIKNLHAVEIVVVEETDEPRSLAGTIYVPHPVKNKGIAYARNLALSNASGELIVFIDDDCIPEDGWLDKLLAPFRESSVVGVQGGVSVPVSASSVGWAETLLGFPGGGIKRIIEADQGNPKTMEISTLNCAYRRFVIEKIGGFLEDLKYGGEDYVFAKQASKLGRCLFVPGAMVLHNPRGSMLNIWKWFVRRGRAEVDTVRTGKQDQLTFFRLAQHSLALKILLILLIGLIAPWTPWPFYGFVLLLHTGFQYKRYYGVWDKSRAPASALLVLPAVKMVMDLASDWGRARELTCG